MAQRFATQGYQDCWAASLFLIQLFASIVLLVVLKFPHRDVSESRGQNEAKATAIFSDLVAIIVGIFFGLAAFAAIVGVAIICFARRYPTQLIWASNTFFTVLCFIVAAVNFAAGITAMGAVWVVFGLFSVLWLYLVRSRVPFAASMLRTASQIALKFRGTWVVSLLFVFVTIAYNFTFFALVAKLSQVINFPLAIFLVLCYYWTTQVISNVVHATTCGTAASWYFGNANTVANPTCGSFKRAMTTSFGSVCFGSLIVAALKTLRFVVRAVARRNALLACLMSCILAYIELWVQYFNEYAFVYVSVYGHGFTTSAKATFNLIKDCGISGIVNDCLVSKVFIMMMLLGSLLTGLLGFGLGLLVTPKHMAFVDDKEMRDMRFAVAFFFVVMGLLIGCMVVSMLTSLLNSNVVTLFVCFAEEPEALQAINPDLHAELVQKISIARGDDGNIQGGDDGDDLPPPPKDSNNSYQPFPPTEGGDLLPDFSVDGDLDQPQKPAASGYDPIANPWPAPASPAE